MIEFKDYPSTETPLNAENLNHNFNELKRKIATARLNGNFTSSSPGNFQKVKIPLGVIGGNTDKITLTDDGGIKIGTGISLILINANFRSRYDWVSTEKQIYISKNGLTDIKGYTGHFSNIGGATSLSITPILLSCSEGDIFYFSYDTNSAETDKTLEGGYSNYVTIEIIE